MTPFNALQVALLCTLLVACSPTFDWRKVEVDGGVLIALFPCRPERRTRNVEIAGAQRPMQLASCDTAQTVFAASFVDVADPAAVTPVLEAMRTAAIANLGRAATARTAPYALRGMTANTGAMRLYISGRLVDGRTVQEHAAFFVKGLRIYQASVIGAAPPAEAIESFFSGLGFAR